MGLKLPPYNKCKDTENFSDLSFPLIICHTSFFLIQTFHGAWLSVNIAVIMTILMFLSISMKLLFHKPSLSLK